MIEGWSSDEEYVIWGCGQKGKEFVEKYHERLRISYCIDSNKYGKLFMGYIVRRHIVGGANRTLFSVDLPPRLCRTGT